MPSILKSLRLLADPTRIRILLLLDAEELSVAELQDILTMGQSRISTHLAQMKAAGLVTDRRAGKNSLYRLRSPRSAALMDVLKESTAEIPELGHDREALQLILRRRQDRMRSYFDELAGRFGRQYVPGRSWQGLAEAVIQLLPPLVIADLGAGEGTFSQLLARRAARVIAVDNSEKMVEYGSTLAREHGLANLEYRLGDLESLPIDSATVDAAILSQALHHARHPERVLREVHRILKPGGRAVILDLLKHGFEDARELYADLWLGFSEVDLDRYLKDSGFDRVETRVVHREPDPPHFETVLAVGTA